MFSSFLKLSSATLLAQVISFLIMPMITRMHTPVSLGEYQYLTTLSLVLLPFVSGKLDDSIKSAASRHQAINNLQFAIQFSVIALILFSLLLLGAAYFLVQSRLSWLVAYLPLLVLFLALSTIFQYAMALLTNEKQYGLQSTYTITKSSISNGLKLVLSYFSPTGFSLVWSLILTELLQVVRLLVLNNKIRLSFFFKFNKDIFFLRLSRLKNYPLYATPAAILGILMNWFPILVAGYFYGAAYTGLLGLAFMVVNTPVYPFISVLRTVCFGEIARDKTKSKMLKIYSRSFMLALLPVVTGLIVLGYWGVELFQLIFGERWGEAGKYAFICFIPISLSFLLSPIYSTLNHFFGFQRLFLINNMIVTSLGISITSFIGYSAQSFEVFLIAFAATMSVNHISLILISVYLTSLKIKAET